MNPSIEWVRAYVLSALAKAKDAAPLSPQQKRIRELERKIAAAKSEAKGYADQRNAVQREIAQMRAGTNQKTRELLAKQLRIANLEKEAREADKRAHDLVRSRFGYWED